MKKLTIILVVLFFTGPILRAQEQRNVEYLKPIEISSKKKNDYTGKYLIEGEKDFYITVEIIENREGKEEVAIIIPDIEKSKGDVTFTEQHALIAQYEDKFYLQNDAFIKVHFTRSKKTKKIISVLYNANRTEGTSILRAKKTEQ